MKAFFLICAALVACTLAQDKKIFYPTDLSCMYHVSYEWMDEDSGKWNLVHEYGIHSNDEDFYIHEIGYDRDDPSKVLYYGTRSYKLKVPGSTNVYGVYYEAAADPPYCDVIEETTYADSYDTPFEYVSDEDCDCVNTSETGCHCYTNETGFTIIVDSIGRFVYGYDEYNITYYEGEWDIDLDDFAITCEDKTVDVPDNVCAVPRTHTPQLPCKYHMKYLWSDADGSYVCEDYSMFISKTDFIYYEIGWNASNLEEELFHGVVDSRRLLQSGEYSSLYFYPGDICRIEEEEIYLPSATMEYETGPNPVDCPDGVSTGCQVYWMKNHQRVIVDSEGRYLVDPNGFIFLGYDDKETDLQNFYPTCPAAQVTIEYRGDICSGSGSTTSGSTTSGSTTSGSTTSGSTTSGSTTSGSTTSGSTTSGSTTSGSTTSGSTTSGSTTSGSTTSGSTTSGSTTPTSTASGSVISGSTASASTAIVSVSLMVVAAVALLL